MIGILEELETLEEEMRDFDKEKLTDLKIERANLKEVKGFQNGDGRLAHTTEERKQ